MERVRFFRHQDKEILFVDLAGCVPADVESIIRSLPDVVTAQPLASVRLLADFTGAAFNDETLRVMKESAIFDKPYTKKTAWIGADDFPHISRKSISDFSRRDFPIFHDRLEALEWLTKD